MPTTGSTGLCATPSATEATAGGTRHRHSPSPHTSDNAGDGHAPSTQAMGERGWERDSAARRPHRRGRALDPPTPPLYSVAEGRTPPPVGGRTGARSARGGPLPRSPLTADR